LPSKNSLDSDQDEDADITDDNDASPVYDLSIQRLDEKSDTERIRRKEDDALKLVETVFDNKTRLILFSMIRKGIILELTGAISTGKEANVYYAPTTTTAIAVKIFRIDAPSFKKMRPYVEGDHRFKRLKGSRSGFIEVWAKKEFKNLKRMHDKDIPVPKPIYVERNILLMEFLGHGDAVLPLLKESDPKNPSDLYKRLMNSVRIMYREAKLVHADLSEFNVLYNQADESYFIIDVSQSVLHDHPLADEFLMRDISNLNRYFASYGVKVIELKRLFKWITGSEAEEILLIKFQT
jgi:RIO kinase 1